MPTVIQTQYFDGFHIDTYSDGTFGYMTDGGRRWYNLAYQDL